MDMTFRGGAEDLRRRSLLRGGQLNDNAWLEKLLWRGRGYSTLGYEYHGGGMNS